MCTRILILCLSLIAGCCGGPVVRRIEVTAPAARAAADAVTSQVRSGWHLPLAATVGVARLEGESGRPDAAEPAEVAAAVRQLAEVREAQSRAAFDFFEVDVLVGAEVGAPAARVSGDLRRLEVTLPPPGADGGAIVGAQALLEALGDGFAWDAVGSWYARESPGELTKALARDLAKLDTIEDQLAIDCGRLELVLGALTARARETDQEPMLTPSEAVFARGAQVRATFALHRTLNTVARWRAAAQDERLGVRKAAQVVLLRARLLHEAYLSLLLDIVVGERPVLAIWEKAWWHRHPLYKSLDASAGLEMVALDGAPPGSIPAGSVRALLRLRYDGDIASCYDAVDELCGALDAAALRGAPLEAACAQSLERSARTRALRDAHTVGTFRAWKETWDARLKQGFQFPFYHVIARISIFLGDTRTSGRAPAIRGPRLEGLAAKLRPGDILLVRQDDFLSNVFLPGFFPHAVLWLGEEAAWTALRLEDGTALKDDPLVKAVLGRFRAAVDEHGLPACSIEAVSEGVQFSSIAHAMSKDYVVALRPTLAEGRVAAAIRRAVTLLGRPYDFNFDFATDERVVCTELVYHAYDSELGFRVQVDAPAPGPSPRVPGVLPVVGRLTMPANEVARYALYMQDHGVADAALKYPGRRLDVLFFADRRDPDAVVYEGPAAVEALRGAVDR